MGTVAVGDSLWDNDEEILGEPLSDVVTDPDGE